MSPDLNERLREHFHALDDVQDPVDWRTIVRTSERLPSPTPRVWKRPAIVISVVLVAALLAALVFTLDPARDGEPVDRVPVTVAPTTAVATTVASSTSVTAPGTATGPGWGAITWTKGELPDVDPSFRPVGDNMLNSFPEIYWTAEEGYVAYLWGAPFVWHSADALTWTRAEIPELAGYFTAFLEHPDRSTPPTWARASDDEGAAHVFRRIDGTWTEVALPPLENPDVAGPDVTVNLQDYIVSGDTTVVRGLALRPGDPAVWHSVLWVSSDEGPLQAVDLPWLESMDNGITSIVAVPDGGFVAYRGVELNQQVDPITVWTSEDGSTWIDRGQLEIFDDLDGVGGFTVNNFQGRLLGSEHTHAKEVPTWESTDGVTWSVVTDGPPETSALQTNFGYVTYSIEATWISTDGLAWQRLAVHAPGADMPNGGSKSQGAAGDILYEMLEGDGQPKELWIARVYG